MSFIQRELDKIETAIRSTPNDDSKAESLRIAQQTLAWVLDPNAVASPSKYLLKFHEVNIVATDGTGLGAPVPLSQ